MAWHLPPRMSKDFFALAVLDPLIVGDQSARLHQKLVRETRQATSVAGAFNLLGTNWDMKGPMLFTVRVDYRPDTTADQVHRDRGRGAGRGAQPGHHRRRTGQRQDAHCARRSSKTSKAADCRASAAPTCSAAFALFDDDPGRVNTILASLDAVTLDDVKAAAGRWFVPANRTTLDSRPAAAPSAPGGAR